MGSTLLLALLTVSPAHMRLSTSRGPVHVLIHPQAELTVVYVHGYWTRLDDAWVQQRLPEQLLGSGLAATFIVPEAPAGPGEDVVWPDLDVLLREVEAQLDLTLPPRVLAAGHSGAYRTLAQWTASGRVSAFVLLDAFYTPPELWDRWLDSRDDARLFVLARATAKRSQPLCARRPGRVQCTASPVGHMQIITQGQWLPRLLKQAN